MAILLTEVYDSVQTITEDANGEKNYYVEGIFMQSEVGNRNGRIYRKEHMEREVNKYLTENINKNKSCGELHHPQNRISIDPERYSHKITELRMEGNDAMGKAKILTKFPCGSIVKNMIDEGIAFGISSRALGSVKKLSNGLNEVQSDFDFRCCDLVTDPSGPNCWMNAVREGAEWVEVNGEWVEQFHEETKSIIRKATSRELNEIILKRFNSFISKL